MQAMSHLETLMTTAQPSTDRLRHTDYLKIAIPFIVSTVTQPLLGAVDTAVIGHLGAAELIGGVAIGTVIMNTLYWLFGFFRTNTTGQSAIAHGRNSESEMAKSLIQPFVLATVVGLAFIVLQQPIWLGARYLLQPDPLVAEQAHTYFTILIWGAPFVLLNYTLIGWLMGQSKIKATLITQIFGNVLNIILDVVFVVGFDMAVGGVAIATLIAQITTFGIGLFVVHRSAGFPIRRYAGMARIAGAELKAILASNTDLLLRTICLLAIHNSMARVGSSLGTDTLATNAVMLQVVLMASYIFEGIANASSVFAGRAVGKKSLDSLNEVIRKNFQWTAVVVVAQTAFIFLSQNHLALLFTRIPDVLRQFDELSPWLILYPVVSGFGLTVYGIFTGTGTTRPIRNSAIIALLVYLGTLALTLDSLKNHGLWLAFSLFYLLRFVFLCPYIGEVRKKCIAERQSGTPA
jgi:multidrug resistance protein, MATE family